MYLVITTLLQVAIFNLSTVESNVHFSALSIVSKSSLEIIRIALP